MKKKLDDTALTHPIKWDFFSSLATSSSSNIPKDYKLISDRYDEESEEEYFIVPREKFIKKILQNYNEYHPLTNRHKVLVTGFSGEPPQEVNLQQNDDRMETDDEFVSTLINTPKEGNLNALLTLPYFRNLETTDVPSMNNGHVKQPFSINRILMLKHKNRLDLIGAIDFKLYFQTQTMTIQYLAVDAAERRKGFGSLLLTSALLITMLYGIEKVDLVSSMQGLPLYIKHDFYMNVMNNQVRDLNAFSQLDFPYLQLFFPKSFDKLLPLIPMPGLNQNSYLLFKQWKGFENLLNQYDGKLTQEELVILENNLQISPYYLNQLRSNMVDLNQRIQNKVTYYLPEKTQPSTASLSFFNSASNYPESPSDENELQRVLNN